MSRLIEKASSVSDAINTRFSCRAFLDKPVPEEDVRYIVETATRAPSGGNLQPWHVYVLQGAPRDKLVATIAEKGAENPAGEGSEYHIYPPELKAPYRDRRFDIGERMYEIMGVARDDKAARFAWLASNFTFFNAPVGMFFALDKKCKRDNGRIWACSFKPCRCWPVSAVCTAARKRLGPFGRRQSKNIFPSPIT